MSAITLTVMLLASSEPGHTSESTNGTTKSRSSTDTDLGNRKTNRDQKKYADTRVSGLSDSEREQLEELWKSVLRTPSVRKLQKQNSDHISLYEFEKIFWEVFDYDVHRKRPTQFWPPYSNENHALGMSLTDPCLEPDYPRHGLEAEPYFYGQSRLSGNRAHRANLAQSSTQSEKRDNIIKAISGILDRLVVDFLLFKEHFLDEAPEYREAARKRIVDAAGEKAVGHLETSMRAKRI